MNFHAAENRSKEKRVTNRKYEESISQGQKGYFKIKRRMIRFQSRRHIVLPHSEF